MKNYFFALGYIPHRVWGSILIPQLLEKDEASMYYVSGEILLKNPDSLSYQKLSPMQKEIVNIIDEYNEVALFKLFSREKTVKNFMDNIDKDILKKHIRPFIEKRLYSALKIASENNFKIFLKEKARQNIFSDDFLTIHKRPAKPLFHFNRTEEGTLYRLSIMRGDESLDLISDSAGVISNSPAVVLVNKDVYFIENTEGSKLTPFFTKKYIEIQKSSEKKYYASFIANTLKEHDRIDAKGFDVIDIVPKKKAGISLETGISQVPVWVLSLTYNNFTMHPGAVQKRFVNFSHKNDHYVFERFTRDFAWEESLELSLEEIGLKSRDRNVYTLRKYLSDDHQDKVYEAIKFTNDNYNFLVESGFSIGQKLDKKYNLRPVELSLESKEIKDWFDIKAQVHFGEHSIPFIKLRKHILQGNRLVELPDGTVGLIPEEWFSKYKATLEFGQIEGEVLRIHKQHFSQVDASVKRLHASTIASLEKLNSSTDLPKLDPPKGLKAVLRDYQLEGYTWLHVLEENGFGGCLADDMGLGKTLQAISILLLNKEKQVASSYQNTPEPGQLSLFHSDASIHTSLIVLPSSLIQNWLNEIRRFAPSLKIIAHSGGGRMKDSSRFNYSDVILSSYHTVRQDIDFLRDYEFHYVILDESQMIKNPHSKIYRAMTDLQASHKLVLTGTPIENSLIDLWSQINFVNEGLLGSLNFFKKQFVKAIEKKKNKDQEERLKQLINPFILRRTKDEVAKELPPVYEHYHYCDMTDEQKRMYEEEKSAVRNSLLENFEEIGLERSALMVLKALTRLRQISNHPILVEKEYEADSGKFEEVFRNIESVVSEDHKVLVFSSFVKHLDLYGQKLDEMDQKYARLTGSTTRRQVEVDKFQEDPECKIFLISLKAGGVGLNLTAADYVFILDPWWNPAAEMQALNRAHRIGQDKSVFVYRFISMNTVEEKIQRLQERKSELAKTFVTSNNPLRNMQQEEIIELFN